MTHTDFISAIKDTFEDALAILQNKNIDYATDTDPWKNFRFAELVGVGVERAILVRMSDKLARISNILGKKARVVDESIVDTLVDLANYSVILKVYLENQKKSDTVKK